VVWMWNEHVIVGADQKRTAFRRLVGRLDFHSPQRGLSGTSSPPTLFIHPSEPNASLRLLCTSPFACWSRYGLLCCMHVVLQRESPKAALALNISIGGSVGNVTADRFLTVQDDRLTSQVCHTETTRFMSC
jgi:hypothetical protein